MARVGERKGDVVAEVAGVKARTRPLLQRPVPAGEVQSVYAAGEQFRGEWVLMQVTDYDEYHAPSHGLVVAHSPSNRSVCRMLDLAFAVTDPPKPHYFLFLAPRLPAPGTDLREIYRALSEEDAYRDWEPARPGR